MEAPGSFILLSIFLFVVFAACLVTGAVWLYFGWRKKSRTVGFLSAFPFGIGIFVVGPLLLLTLIMVIWWFAVDWRKDSPSSVPLHIDLSELEHLGPKGRVQDKDYNPHLPIIDTLIEQGTNAVPLLIEMLSDDTAIEPQIIDYWPSNTVGDIALVILTDLTTDSDWKTSTIPGTSWDEILGKPTTNYVLIPPYYQLQDFKQKHGSKEIQKRWQRIWLEHQRQIYWDAKDRCFRLRRDPDK